MKTPINIAKEWCLNMASKEGNQEIGAGLLPTGGRDVHDLQWAVERAYLLEAAFSHEDTATARNDAKAIRLILQEIDAGWARKEGNSALDMWDEILAFDDRTSPEEYPDMCLVTFEEFARFIRRGRQVSP